MPKEIAQPTPDATTQEQGREHKENQQSKQPLSGSKKVKNRNHSRHNHGEGS